MLATTNMLRFELSSFWLTCSGGRGRFQPLYQKMAITLKNNDPKEPKPLHTIWGLKMAKKEFFYSIFVVSGTNFRIIKFSFLAIFEEND